ncbi:MAG: LysR family transcriptional regulator [Ornithinimicrobium sp.]
MDLVRHLRLFVAVAEHRHFGHAAVALGMTQPPVSQGVQRLERTLQQRLFDRSARGVSLTGAGHALLPSARAVLDQSDGLIESARRWRPVSSLRVGLAEDLDGWIPSITARLASRGHDVLPLLAGTTDLVNQMREGDLDLAVVRHPALLDGVHGREVVLLASQVDTESLLRHRMPVAVPPRRHHPAAHDQLVDALLRLGHPGTCVELSTAAERAAWAAARRAVEWKPAPVGVASSCLELPPLRYRLITPSPDARQGDHDHDAIARCVEQTLRGEPG